ncbi:MAG: MBL fold metallo-hydrolase [Anaerolineales bacterium]
MADKLLVRIYNVGLGDCIYLRVPDENDDVHILIDCGNKFSELELLGQHIGELKADLPDAGAGKKRLDLLVVTHPHEDHHKGFEGEFFADLKIEHIWLSPAYDRMNPNAQGFHALQDAAQRALQGLSELAAGELKVEAEELLRLSKSEAIAMLTSTLPQANGIQPLYVSADTPGDQIRIFEDPGIQLKVLGPMGDIDAYYLGGDGLQISSTQLTSQGMADEYQSLFQFSEPREIKSPKNISSQDFKSLTKRVSPFALAAAEIAGHATNNLSVVLLLEWHGRRLLFPGDAEWDGAYQGQVRPKRGNGAWNVMWKERQADLSQPLDFLKIGHHGSENATPWTPPDPETGEEHPINQILDHLLPLPEAGQIPIGYAVASTQRTSRWPSIPDPQLMMELGKRVANASSEYIENPKHKHVLAGASQPQRTDLEAQVTLTPDVPVPYIEIEFAPKG